MKKTFLILTLCTVFLLALAAGAVFLYENLKDLETQREVILRAAKSALNRDMAFKQAAFSLRPWPAFTFTEVTVREKDGTAIFLSVERLVLKVAILPLLKKEMVIRDVNFSRPCMALSRDPAGKWNVDDLLAVKGEAPIRVRRVTVEGGELTFHDRSSGTDSVDLLLKDLNLTLRGLHWGDKTQVDLKAALQQGSKEGRIGAEGAVDLPAAGRPWTEAALDMRFHIRNVDLKPFRPYYRSHVPSASVKAVLDTDAAVKGNWKAFSSSGTITLHNPELDCPRVFSSMLRPERVQCVYDVQRHGANVALKKLHVSVDELRMQGSADIQDLGTDDPMMDIRATLAPFSYERYRAYLPFGLIPESVAAYMRNHIRAGNFRLIDGRLSGHLSQIRNINQTDNVHILHARIGVEKGILTYGENVPLIREVKGELVFQGADFLLKGLSGRFGDAPLTLDGSIRNYALDMPSTYPFTMTMKPGSREIAWLMGAEAMKKLKINGNSALKLSGDGPLDNYILTGDWDLTSLAYTVGPLIKPAGRTNRLHAAADVRGGEWQVRNFQYDLFPVSLSGTARYRFKTGEQAAIAVRSNTFDLSDLTPLIPEIKPHRPEGRVRIQFNGESRPEKRLDLQWNGTVSLDDVSINPMAGITALKNIRGVVRLSGDVFSTAGLSGRLGPSSFLVRGRYENAEKPTADINFSAESLNTADLGYTGPRGPVRIQDLQGRLIMSEEKIQVRSLSARFYNSAVTAGLSWSRQTRNPLIDFQVTAPSLELNDILMIANLKSTVPEKTQSAWSCRGRVQAAKGKLGKLDFTDLSVDVAYRKPDISFTALGFQALGGHFSGTGGINVKNGEHPLYDFHYQINGVPASALLKMTDRSPDLLSGAVSSKGHLTASGTSMDAVKRTLTGTMDVQVAKGVLKEFAVLSKVFSLLNVSQLLKFQLPDMAAGGMPFTDIAATLSMKDGVLSTENAFLKSDAMNMLAIGKADMVKETLDITLGLQPLQTVDKVISRIPVLGWVLTDKDKRFITVYFEARGPWKDPDVRAMPVRDMAKGVFDIFKRVLQLPVKIITDTGDVL